MTRVRVTLKTKDFDFFLLLSPTMTEGHPSSSQLGSCSFYSALKFAVFALPIHRKYPEVRTGARLQLFNDIKRDILFKGRFRDFITLYFYDVVRVRTSSYEFVQVRTSSYQFFYFF